MSSSLAVTVREATPADHALFVRLFPMLGVTDPILTAEQFTAQIVPHAVIAELDGVPCGYAHFRYYGRLAHVVHVIVDVPARGARVGRALMEAVRVRVVVGGATGWYLNVKTDNALAIRLYERAGMRAERQGWTLKASWTDLLAMTSASKAVPFTPTDAEASDLARRTGIDPDRLAVVRARPGTLFFALHDDREPCGLAVFDPAFPGLYPVATTHPSHAPPLFRAVHPHARSPDTNLFVEGDAGLAGALQSAGAKLLFEILRMAGELAPRAAH